jgi:hypothetical protein
MSHHRPGSEEDGADLEPAPGRPGFNPGVHLALLVLGLAPAAVLMFMASLTICGISGCSGGGFGRATDPNTTRVLLIGAGLVAAAPLATYAGWRRRLGTALFAAAVAIVVTIGSGVLIGADFRGCPRDVDTATCMDEAS